MTVSAVTPSVLYQGDGLTTVFPFAFPMDETSSLEVVFVDRVTHQITPVSPTDYTTTITSAGGTVTFLVAPEASDNVNIARTTDTTQLVSVAAQAAYNPQVVEAVWDKLTMLVQEALWGLGIAVKAPPGVDPQTLYNNLLQAWVDAEAARDKARAWAEAPEDTPVEPGQYSALHYAAKAEGSAARVDLGALDQAVSDAQDWAEGEGEPGDPGSKSAKGWAETAEIARDKAKDWAENPEDEPVGEGKYSALHHAAKAALAETGAQTAQGLAEAARDAIVDSDQIYESTSAGISGTTDQDYFWVVPSTIEGSIDLYRNESGTAVLKAAIFNFSSAMKTQDEAWSI